MFPLISAFALRNIVLIPSYSVPVSCSLDLLALISYGAMIVLDDNPVFRLWTNVNLEGLTSFMADHDV